jgi:hypothetical protein
MLVSILSTKEFGGNSLRFGGKPFFLKMGAGLLKKGVMTLLSRKTGVPAKKIITKCTDQVFLWYQYGKTKKMLINTNQNFQIDIQLYMVSNDKDDGDSDEGGGQATATRAMTVVTTVVDKDECGGQQKG